MSTAVGESPIVRDPEIMSGTPVFRGTRVPVRSFFDWLMFDSLDVFLENFPSVSREQAVEVLHLAESQILVTHEIDGI